MNQSIRAAAATDKAAILDLIGSHLWRGRPWKWDRPLAERYFNVYFRSACNCLQEDAVFVLTVEGEVIGVTGYSVDRYESDNYWLGWLYVHPGRLHGGLGQRLLQHVESVLVRRHVRSLLVTTSSHPFYERARGLYRRAGYEEVARIPDYYETGEDQIILRRRL